MIVTLPAGRKFTCLFLALLALGVAVSYSDSLGVGFYFDDTYGIANNPAIRSLKNIPSFFVDPRAVWTEPTQVDLRPVLLITYAVNYAVSGLQPWSYHVLNLILHFIASWLVFIIVRDHLWRFEFPHRGEPAEPWPASERGPDGAARIPAAAAALFFALAPLNSQPVNYIWARSALLCVTLYLGAFLTLLSRRWILGSALFVLALLTKAIAVTLPLVFLIHDFVYRDRSRYPTIKSYAAGWRRLSAPLALLAALAVAYVGYRKFFLPDWAAATRHAFGVTPAIWFMSQWSALLYYVRLFLWPDGLSADHDFPLTTSLLAVRAWGALAVLLAWAGLALAAMRRHPQVTFATAWFFVTLAPESSFAPLAEVINDHRPYIASSLGLAVLLAWSIERAAVFLFAERQTQRQLAFITVSLILCVAAVPVNRHRTWQWLDPLRMWEDTTRKSPNNSRAWMNAGLQYMTRGDLVSARRFYERAKEISPQYAFLRMNLSVLEAHEGNLDKALAEAEEAVRLRPDLSLTHFYLGQALKKMGRTAEAAAAYKHAIQLDPRYKEAKEALALIEKSDGQSESALMAAGLYALNNRRDPQAAVVEFRKVLERNPKHYGATFQLARALDQAGKPKEAHPLWEKVLAMAQNYNDKETAETARARLVRSDVMQLAQPETMKKGLDLLYTRRDAAAAAGEFRKILEQNPNHYGATFQLATALDRAGKTKQARPLWEKMLKLAEAAKDQETAKTAKDRLASGP
jgi:tetratricopeptide (TPR) repeat protein